MQIQLHNIKIDHRKIKACFAPVIPWHWDNRVSKTGLRIVNRGGIYWCGNFYYHPRLHPYNGEFVEINRHHTDPGVLLVYLPGSTAEARVFLCAPFPQPYPSLDPIQALYFSDWMREIGILRRQHPQPV